MAVEKRGSAFINDMIHTKVRAVMLLCFIDKKIFQNVFPIC